MRQLGPEGLRLGRSGGDAQHLALAVLVHRDGDCHGTADGEGMPATGSRAWPNPALADLEVGGIEPEVGPGSLQGPGEERVHALVDLDAEAADPGSSPGQALGLRHAARAHGLDQVVHGPGRNAVDAGFL